MALLYTVNEVRYFYLGLVALGQVNGTVTNDQADDLIRAELNRFNDARNRRYTLRERVYAFAQTPRIILSELRQYGLVTADGRGSTRQWTLTDEGWRLYRMQQSPANRLALRAEFAVIHLNTFPTIFRNLLETVQASPTGMIGIPRLSRIEFEGVAPDGAAAQAADVAWTLLLHHGFALPPTVHAALQDDLARVVALTLHDGKSLAAALEHAIAQFFVRYFFSFLYSKARYAMVRDRSTFLGLMNYFRVGRPSAGLEIIYPVAHINGDDAPPGWQRLTLASGYLHLRHPTWAESSAVFLSALEQAYSLTPRAIGYANVADLRDRVCFALRWPDFLFDEFLQQAIHNTQNNTCPLQVYVDSSLGPAMPLLKRAPLEFGPRAFNLVRVQPANGGQVDEGSCALSVKAQLLKRYLTRLSDGARAPAASPASPARTSPVSAFSSG